MFPCLGFGSGYGWIFPLVMIAMMALCFFMMRGHGGGMMCSGRDGKKASDSPLDILSRKYAHGKINKQEYEKGKEDIELRMQQSTEKNHKEASNER